jgi:hypothetical protein
MPEPASRVARIGAPDAVLYHDAREKGLDLNAFAAFRKQMQSYAYKGLLSNVVKLGMTCEAECGENQGPVTRWWYA